MTYRDDPILIGIKWTLFIINLISALYVAIIFFNYLSGHNRVDSLSVPFMFNCIVGFLVSFLGFYGAYTADKNMLVMYGIILIINLVVGSFGGPLVYPVNLGLYAICVILAFMYAYFIHNRISPATSGV
ncbi:hypothetical protein HDE_05834 [Halotydeus destructor]|nr:hypothetical protein HDE_05834 [Halotydeus destructor]